VGTKQSESVSAQALNGHGQKEKRKGGKEADGGRTCQEKAAIHLHQCGAIPLFGGAAKKEKDEGRQTKRATTTNCVLSHQPCSRRDKLVTSLHTVNMPSTCSKYTPSSPHNTFSILATVSGHRHQPSQVGIRPSTHEDAQQVPLTPRSAISRRSKGRNGRGRRKRKIKRQGGTVKVLPRHLCNQFIAHCVGGRGSETSFLTTSTHTCTQSMKTQGGKHTSLGNNKQKTQRRSFGCHVANNTSSQSAGPTPNI